MPPCLSFILLAFSMNFIFLRCARFLGRPTGLGMFRIDWQCWEYLGWIKQTQQVGNLQGWKTNTQGWTCSGFIEQVPKQRCKMYWTLINRLGMSRVYWKAPKVGHVQGDFKATKGRDCPGLNLLKYKNVAQNSFERQTVGGCPRLMGKDTIIFPKGCPDHCGEHTSTQTTIGTCCEAKPIQLDKK